MDLRELLGWRKNGRDILDPVAPPFEIIRFADYSQFSSSSFSGIEIPSPVYPEHLTGTYVDGSNKYARQIYNCVVLVIAGFDNNKMISALPHMATNIASDWNLVKGDRVNTENERIKLRHIITKIKSDFSPENIYAGLLGGNTSRVISAGQYVECKKFLNNELGQFGIPLEVLIRPNDEESIIMDVYLDTQRRKLIVVNRIAEPGEVIMD